MQTLPQPGPYEDTAEEVLANITVGRDLVPDHLWPGIRNFILDGSPQGDFLRFVFENNLLEVACRMDEASHQRLGDLMRFMHNYAPDACWRTPAAVFQWVEAGGIRGGAHLLELVM